MRLARDTFEVDGVAGPHICIVHEPLSLSLRDIRGLVGGKFPESFVKPMVVPILLALDYLHSVAGVVHTGSSYTCYCISPKLTPGTGIQEGNI